MSNKKVQKQYLVTMYDDGTLTYTARKMPKRDRLGRYAGKRRAPKQNCAICPLAWLFIGK